MAILRLAKMPEPILRKSCLPVKDVNDQKVQTLINDMIQTVQHYNGMGLACNQVGKSLRIVVLNIKPFPIVMINPVITNKSPILSDSEEGCLSVPGIFEWIKRADSVEVTFLSRKGKEITRFERGMNAIVIQHEVDHLNGILFTDYLQ